MKGYIKLYRKTMCSPIWQDPYYLKLWMYCLMKASHKEREQMAGNQIEKLKPGQFITGRKVLTEDMNKGMKPEKKLSEKSWERYLKNLEKWQMLTIKTTNKYSVITVLKWEEYQEVDQQVTNNCPTSDQQVTTNKNVKNVKNDKKNKYSDFVSMTQSEYEKLIEQFGESGTAERIEQLNLYKGSTGKNYKNDYLTILSWERKNTPKTKEKKLDWEVL